MIGRKILQTVLMVVVSLGVVGGAPSPTLAQYHDFTVPADSTFWWTLSDRITPSELKELLSDRAQSLVRYDAAVKAGLEPPLSAAERQGLEFYVNEQQTPELFPMWLAFDLFSRIYLYVRRDAPDVVQRDLARHGLSAGGITSVLVAAEECKAKREELMSVLGPRQGEMQLLLRDRFDAEAASRAPGGQPLDKALGDKPILESIKERDYDRVALVVGRPASEIRELVDAMAVWGRPGGGGWTVAECLPVLQSRVSDSDWKAFQRFLRDVIVSPMSPSKVISNVAEAGR